MNANKVHTLTGHTDCVYALSSADASGYFFSGGGDGMVVRWDLQNPAVGTLIARLPNSIYALHYLKDKNLLVAGQNNEGIHLLDGTNKKEVKSLHLGMHPIFDIQSLDNELFIASGDGSVSVVDLDRWVIRLRSAASQKSARTIAVNPHTRELVVGYSDHMIRVLSMDTLEVKKQWIAHQNSVFTLQFSPDYRVLLSGSRDARLKVWSPEYELVTEVVAHLYAINSIAFSPDGKHFVTCSLDKSIKVWDSREIRLLKVIDKARHAGHSTSVNKLLWTSFNNLLVSASDDRTLSVWNFEFDDPPTL